jgi:hypothetical protein
MYGLFKLKEEEEEEKLVSFVFLPSVFIPSPIISIPFLALDFVSHVIIKKRWKLNKRGRKNERRTERRDIRM